MHTLKFVKRESFARLSILFFFCEKPKSKEKRERERVNKISHLLQTQSTMIHHEAWDLSSCAHLVYCDFYKLISNQTSTLE